MKWRFVDRVTLFEPWVRIEGLKCISLEEYSLLKRFGRKGTMPATLVMESCVDLARWLAMGSSRWTQGAVLSDVAEMRFEREVGMSDVLRGTVKASCASEHVLEAACEARVEGDLVMQGRFTVELVALAQLLDPDDVEALWKEIHGAA
jgi:3-hydroxymyristoyl/3-hydroxydecanoyl-(acyl carrier protein) dehydratase